MIFVDLSEGLGNQMFQYAFARKMQEIYGDFIHLDTQSYRRNKGKRSFSLSNFVLNDKVTYGNTVLERLIDTYIKVKRKIIRTNKDTKNKDISYSFEKKGLYLNDNTFGYVDYDYNSKRKNKYVMGSWMNYKFVRDIEDVLKKEFSVKKELTEENQKLINEIKNKNSVCIHIRLGDYLSPEWSYLNVCTAKYYKESYERMKEKLDNPTFYVFSNTSKDLKWIKENYSFLSDCNFIDMGNCDYEDLELMKNCHHFIISNSTYSWWAQFLSPYENKIVMAPSIWSNKIGNVEGYNICGETIGIYQDNWNIIDV